MTDKTPGQVARRAFEDSGGYDAAWEAAAQAVLDMHCAKEEAERAVIEAARAWRRWRTNWGTTMHGGVVAEETELIQKIKALDAAEREVSDESA